MGDGVGIIRPDMFCMRQCGLAGTYSIIVVR